MLRRLPPVLAVIALLVPGCTPKQLVVRTTALILPDEIAAMNAEPDLEVARAASAANLKLIEGLLRADPHNRDLAAAAAQAFAGYALAFVEADDPPRAAELYRRGKEIGLAALARDRHIAAALAGSDADFVAASERIGAGAKELLLWTAVCWGKWVDLSRTDPAAVADLPRVEALRLLALDEGYYYAAPHIFLGTFYGARAPMLGGRPAEARQHFERAIALSGGRFLFARLYYAQYYARQTLDRSLFEEQLGLVLAAPEDLLPEMRLANTVAKRRAAELLVRVDEWFD
jgi:tetratricopeptide (TPR) repeat protein